MNKINRNVNRFFTKIIRYPVLGAIFSLIVGITVNILFSLGFNSTENSIIAGLLASILTELIILSNSFKLNNDVLSTIREKINLLDDNGSVSNLIAIKQITSLKSSNSHIEVMTNGINILEPFVPDFWTLCISNLEKELKVATYINVESWWENPASNNNLLIQEFKATIQTPKINIYRTFIYNPEMDSLEKLELIAESQAVRGINVKYITLNEVQKLVNKYKLPTENMHLIDQKWVGYHMLDDNREPLEFKITKDFHDYSVAISFFSELEQISKSFNFSLDTKEMLMIEKKKRFLQEFRNEILKNKCRHDTFREDISYIADKAFIQIGETKI